MIADQDPLVFWTEIYALAATATLLVLGAAAAIAWNQFQQAKKAWYAETLADLSHRWDEEQMVESRLLASHKGRGSDLRDWVEYYQTDPVSKELFVLQRVPNYFEDLAVLEEYEALPFELIKGSFGGTLVLTWDQWKSAVEFLRLEEQYDPIYAKFQGLAEKMRVALPPPVVRNQP
jgi:hypothetical protein